MAISLNDNIQVLANKPTDNRYGPWTSTTEANSTIVPSQRFLGLTVGIVSGGTVTDYWYASGTTNSDLVIKSVVGQNGNSGTSGISGTSGTSGTSGISGTSGSSGTSGTSGVIGSSGTSGTDGLSRTSGTSGSSGSSGPNGTDGNDGANSGVWGFQGGTLTDPDTSYFTTNSQDFDSVTGIYIDIYDINNISFYNWLLELKSFSDIGGLIYLQITQVDNNAVQGTYLVGSIIDNTTYFEITFQEQITSNTSLSTEKTYTISWVSNGALLGKYLPLSGGTITGTTGEGYIGFTPQQSIPDTPLNGFRLFGSSTGLFSWRDTNGIITTIDDSGLSSSRTYIFPNENGTLLTNDLTLQEVVTNGNKTTNSIYFTAISTTGFIEINKTENITNETGYLNFFRSGGTISNLNSTGLTFSATSGPGSEYSLSGFTFRNSSTSPTRTISIVPEFSGTTGILTLPGENGTIATKEWSTIPQRFFSTSGGTLSGTSGNGFVGFPRQISDPASPINGYRLYSNTNDALTWENLSGITTTIEDSGLTASRTYILPNSSGTFSLNETQRLIRMFTGSGINGTIAANTTVFFIPGNSAGGSLTFANGAVLTNQSGVLRNLQILTTSIQSTGGTLVFTVMVNNVATSISITVPTGGAAGLYLDTTNTATVNVGDTFSIRAVNNAASVASASINVHTLSLFNV